MSVAPDTVLISILLGTVVLERTTLPETELTSTLSNSPDALVLPEVVLKLSIGVRVSVTWTPQRVPGPSSPGP